MNCLLSSITHYADLGLVELDIRHPHGTIDLDSLLEHKMLDQLFVGRGQVNHALRQNLPKYRTR